jgi:hypothetical protein
MGRRNMWPYRICAWRRMLGWILPVFTEKCGVSGLLSCSQLQYNQYSYRYLNLYTWTWLCLVNMIWVVHDHSVHTVLTVSVRLIVMFNCDVHAPVCSQPHTLALTSFSHPSRLSVWNVVFWYAILWSPLCTGSASRVGHAQYFFFFTFFVTPNLEQYL